MANRRSLGEEMFAFVRYIAIASAIFVMQTILLSIPQAPSIGFGSVIALAILTAMVTVVLATVSSAIPFAVMAVIANRSRINTVLYFGLAGCLMAAFTSLEISSVKGFPPKVILPRWDDFCDGLAWLLLPVVTATLAYWRFDVRKESRRSMEQEAGPVSAAESDSTRSLA